MPSLAGSVAVGFFCLAANLAFAAQPPARGCSEWRTCRGLALEAEARGEFEAFHDFAWRTVQTGPPKDPALLFLLARAQALSGRPHDALVMLERIASTGVASSATTDEAFARTRQLPGWSAVDERLRQAALPPPQPTAAVSIPPTTRGRTAPEAPRRINPEPGTSRISGRGALPPPASALRMPAGPPAMVGPPTSGAPTTLPVLVKEAARFTAAPFTVAGLAFDGASDRFVFGDRTGRKLLVVGNGAGHAVDLVRAESAGFQDILAIEIDAARGDLWALSGERGGAAVLHRVQLISGRPLRTFPIGPGPASPVDLAITREGRVLILDSAGRLMHLQPRGAALETLMQLDVAAPTSITAADEDGIAYVAHREGISRIDLRARRATPLSASSTVLLGGIERIRFHQNALLAVYVDGERSGRVLRFDLNARGTTVTKAALLDAVLPPGAPLAFALDKGDMLFAVGRAATGDNAGGKPPDATQWVTYRISVTSH